MLPKRSSAAVTASVTCAWLGHVQSAREGVVGVRVGEVLNSGDVAGGDDDVVTALERRVGEGPTQSGRASGDQPGGQEPLLFF